MHKSRLNLRRYKQFFILASPPGKESLQIRAVTRIRATEYGWMLQREAMASSKELHDSLVSDFILLGCFYQCFQYLCGKKLSDIHAR